MVQNNDHLFTWDQIPGKDNQKLITFLKDTFNINWVEHAKLSKSVDGNKIDITNENQSIKIIRDNKEKAIIKFRDDRVYQRQVNEENGTVQTSIKEISPALESSGLEKQVGPLGVILITVYLIALSIFLLAGLVTFIAVTAEGYELEILNIIFTKEANLLIVVALSGALGGVLHTIWSFVRQVGNGFLVWNWIPLYISYPIMGAILGVIVSLIVLGGFFSLQPTGSQTTTSFAALAALAGMFSPQFMLKLRREVEQRLAKAPTEEDYLHRK